MKLKNQYYILRHGQTIYQTKKKNFIYPAFPENPPIKLTKKGQSQIKKGAKLLKKEGIDLIFASDFFRTKQTAQIVAKEIRKKIVFDKRLRDVNLGIYHGRKKEEFYQKFPRDFKSRLKMKPEKGENWADVRKRMLNFLKEIDKKYQGKKILIISHGDPLWLLEGTVKGWSPEKFNKTKKANFIKPGELRKLN